MHRLSAEDNPAAPLSHHQLDATHITHGLVTGGFTHSALTFEGSWFRGAEPDEDRTDIEMGKLDSYFRPRHLAARRVERAGERRPSHPARVRGAVQRHDETDRVDHLQRRRRTAGHHAGVGREPRESTASSTRTWPKGRWRPRDRQTWYARAELSTKDILGRQRYGIRRDSFHFHPLSRVGAVYGGSQSST
jgi:hypothetical protein